MMGMSLSTGSNTCLQICLVCPSRLSHSSQVRRLGAIRIPSQWALTFFHLQRSKTGLQLVLCDPPLPQTSVQGKGRGCIIVLCSPAQVVKLDLVKSQGVGTPLHSAFKISVSQTPR